MEDLDSIHRTIIIDNIPNEVTEDQLIENCRQVGNVTQFKMVRDRDIIKNKMVAYCEYSHMEMALNATKILNGTYILGQQLRVVLITESEEMNKSLSSQTESGKDQSGESGEAITQAVASLPPDQMYELMKQMKLCIQNNPNEARNMLLQNPQLAYALLQAQIVMKIADPKVAIAMLNRSSEQIPQMVLESPSVKGSQGFPSHGRPISVYPNTEPQHSILTPSSSFDKMDQDNDPGIETLSKFLTTNNQISFLSRNSSDLSQSSLQSGLGNNSNFNRSKKDGSKGKVESYAEKEEREKAALIMQVLKLTDQQIAMLPEDQRRSILVLKDQLRKG